MTDRQQLLNRLNRVEKFLGLVLTASGTPVETMQKRLKYIIEKYQIIA